MRKLLAVIALLSFLCAGCAAGGVAALGTGSVVADIILSSALQAASYEATRAVLSGPLPGPLALNNPLSAPMFNLPRSQPTYTVGRSGMVYVGDWR